MFPIPKSFSLRTDRVQLRFSSEAEVRDAMDYLEPIVRSEGGVELSFAGNKNVRVTRILGYAGESGEDGWTRIVLVFESDNAAKEFTEGLEKELSSR